MSQEVAEEPIAVAGVVANPFAELEAIGGKNHSRVGSVRPSALLYTSGIGATVDMPHIAVMPQGLDAWEIAYSKQGGAQLVLVPRLLEAVRKVLPRVEELRQPPWLPEKTHEGGTPIGIPTRVFPQWLRCTGCDLLAPISESHKFEFVNTSKHRPDKAQFVHKSCKGRPTKGQKQGNLDARDRLAVPARYLIACVDGHLDEFPYVEWVHGGDGEPVKCKVAKPEMRMMEWRSNLGPQVKISCAACEASRNIAELTRAGGEEMLPDCRGRHPHLPTYAPADKPCQADVRLMLLGAANQWFPASVSVLVLPARKHITTADVADTVKGLPAVTFADVQTLDDLPGWRKYGPKDARSIFDGIPDDALWNGIKIARGHATAATDTPATPSGFDPISLLEPEWDTLVHPEEFEREDRKAGFRVRPVEVAHTLQSVLSHVVAVERVKKANAFLGFTRIDALDRVGDAPNRIAPLVQSEKPKWVPATEDRGEGVFLRFDEDVIRTWEDSALNSDVWRAHVAAHQRNVGRRQSRTAEKIDAADRMPPPRYWALHTMSHLLIREMAMSSGYGSASLSERLYAWRETEDREAAAGILIATTSPDSEGTLGGLVDLARTERLEVVFRDALRRAERCSSDPICAHRVPSGQEDFLHGAACHFCLFVSETSCEKANRFLDRRFALTLNAGAEHAINGLVQPVLAMTGD
ncbi:DrmB family protein [Arthrobacter monumenti]